MVGRFRWVTFIGNQLIYGLAVMLSIVIVGEIDSESMWRFIAALSIVVGAITLIIPILHRIGRMGGAKLQQLMPNDQRNIASIDEEIARLHAQIEQLERVKATILDERTSEHSPPERAC